MPPCPCLSHSLTAQGALPRDVRVRSAEVTVRSELGFDSESGQVSLIEVRSESGFDSESGQVSLRSTLSLSQVRDSDAESGFDLIRVRSASVGSESASIHIVVRFFMLVGKQF